MRNSVEEQSLSRIGHKVSFFYVSSAASAKKEKLPYIVRFSVLLTVTLTTQRYPITDSICHVASPFTPLITIISMHRPSLQQSQQY